MNIKYIDYHVNEHGFSKMPAPKLRQTEHNIHRLRIYADFDTTGESPYLVQIVFTRVDRLVVGPVSMTLAQDEEGKWHRYIDIEKQLTELVGELVFGFTYKLWEENEKGVLVLKKQFPIFKDAMYVYDANMNVYDKNYDIYKRLADLEGFDDGGFTEKLLQFEERLDNIEINAVMAESLTEANESEKVKKAGAIAFIVD